MSNETMLLSGDAVRRAAEAIRSADALLIGAGAGMGVDSGLPDFRGTEGFWRAYPPLAKLGLAFEEIANPGWFERDATLAWGFYGHRLNLYRATEPHAGFGILRSWAETKPGGYFVFTSNVDGHFQRAGFDPQRVVEAHGSIRLMQCARGCGSAPWDADDIAITVDEETLRADMPLPTCPACGGIARPNLLMFNDSYWQGDTYEAQHEALLQWVGDCLTGGAKLTVIECGAGSAVPTVRWMSDRLRANDVASLIRINPRETDGPERTITLASGALDALTRIQNYL